MNGIRIAIRADASPRIGTGHVMRCAALADEIRRRGGHVRFVSHGLPEHLMELLVQRGHEVASLGGTDSASDDARLTMAALADRSWDWVVVDHYALDHSWETALRGAGKRIMVIDDLADRAHDCDLLVDQNYYSDMETRYAGKLPKHCRTALGPRYALLRQEFAGLRAAKPAHTGAASRILVFFGGVDAANYTARAVSALDAFHDPDLRVDVIIGLAHPARGEVEQACGELGFHCHVQPANVAELMSQADLAIGAGGATVWERCCLGLPALTFVVAENQRRQVRDAAVNGLLYAPSEPIDTESILRQVTALRANPFLLQAISRAGVECVDGRGVQRVAALLGTYAVTVRAATSADSTMILSWRNDPAVRAVSRSKGLIAAAQHEEWLARTLADDRRILLVGERGGEGVGVARFDLDGSDAEVSIYLAPDAVGSGAGSELLLAAEAWLARERAGVTLLIAEVLGDNERSHRLFQSVGYSADSTIYRKSVPAA